MHSQSRFSLPPVKKRIQNPRAGRALNFGMNQSRQNVVNSLMKQGVKDPRQVLDYVNYTEDRKLVGDFTPGEVEFRMRRATQSKLLPSQQLGPNTTPPPKKQEPPFFKEGGWIQGAINPAHKGYCTPMTKKTCTGARRNFAMTMKKHHGFQKDLGGTLTTEDPTTPPSTRKNLFEKTDPTFNNQPEFDLFYKKKALKLLQTENPDKYEEYFSDNATGKDVGGGLSVLMTQYDFPQFRDNSVNYKVPIHYLSYDKPQSQQYKKDVALIDSLAKTKSRNKGGRFSKYKY